MNARESAALDNYITGHWGEDEFKGEYDWDEFLDGVFSECIFEQLGQCPLLKMCNDKCLVVKGFVDKYEESMRETDYPPEVCSNCSEDYKTCDKDPGECEEEQWGEYAQSQFDGMREL